MTHLSHKKKWFTMIEVLIVIILVSTTFMWIISATISTTNYLTATRQKVTALNLAKEWIEIMYNIRNTNWKRRYNQKDENWLKKDPFDTTSEEKDTWIHEWRWIIKAQTWESNNKYFSLENVEETGNLLKVETEMQRDISILRNKIINENFLNDDYKLHLLNGKRYNNKDLDNFTWENIAVWSYYRYIAVDWLYLKGWTTNEKKLTCKKANDISEWITCWDKSAKELRFCSIVIYTSPKFWAVQICSIMTNFEE